MSRITMKDIADRVGVSTNTVSRALANKPDISPETRGEILSVAKKLGYPYARATRAARRSRIVGLIVSDNSNPFYSRVVKGGVILLDDYGFIEYKDSERKAADEFFATRPEKPIVLTTGQAFVIKI